MGASDKVRALLALHGKKIVELADYFGMTRQSMSNKMQRDSWTCDDLEKVAAFVECDLLFEMGNGQRVYLYAKEDKERFGPRIPRMSETTQIGENEFIDKKGNSFNRTTIEVNEAMGGGYERVSASMFDNPKGLRGRPKKKKDPD